MTRTGGLGGGMYAVYMLNSVDERTPSCGTPSCYNTTNSSTTSNHKPSSDALVVISANIANKASILSVYISKKPTEPKIKQGQSFLVWH